jgi:hypothetical protein
MPIGNGFTVTFSMNAGRMEAAFAPGLPKGRKARRFLASYRLARDEFLRRVALRTGLTVGVVEV